MYVPIHIRKIDTGTIDMWFFFNEVKSGIKSRYIEMLHEHFPIRRIQKGDFASHASFWILCVEFWGSQLLTALNQLKKNTSNTWKYQLCYWKCWTETVPWMYGHTWALLFPQVPDLPTDMNDSLSDKSHFVPCWEKWSENRRRWKFIIISQGMKITILW